MKLSSANSLRSGKREIRALNDVCDASCFVWFSCSNSVPSGTCRGFALMNHQTRTHLNRMLNEDDNKYIENCVNTIQRGCDEETRESLVSEVLRYLPPKESERKEGFSAMLEASRGVQDNPTATAESEEVTHPNSEFIRMLEASGKGSTTREQPRTTTQNTTMMVGLLRQVEESQFPEFCDPQKCPKDFSRHCRANRPENFGKACIYKTLKNR